jgi:hypothetical protein
MSETSSQLLKTMMKDASIEKWCDYVEMTNKNFWTLQNNWMARVESKFGQEAAVELDGMCYGRAIEVAAFRMKQFFDFEDDDLDRLAKVYQLTPGGSYCDMEFIRASPERLIRRVSACPIQLTRIRQDMGLIACKAALTEAAEKIARVINPSIKITKVLCPPDPMPEGLWCDVEFELRA